MLSFQSFVAGWTTLLFWSFSFALPQAFDDTKSLLFYVGAVFLVIASSVRTESRRGPFVLRCLVYAYLAWAAMRTLLAETFAYEGWVSLSKIFLVCGLGRCFQVLPGSVLNSFVRSFFLNTLVVSILTAASRFGFSPFSDLEASFVPPVGHITFFSDLVALGVLMGLHLEILSRSRHRWIFWASLFLFFVLWTSGGRASFMTCGLCVVFYLFLAWKTGHLNRRQMAHWVAGFACVVFVSGWIPKEAQLRSATMIERMGMLSLGGDGSTGHRILGSNGRTLIYSRTWKLISERFFEGWGLGTFQYVYPKARKELNPELSDLFSADQWLDHPHNEVLYQMSELGFVGAVLFVGLCAGVIVLGLKRMRRLQRDNGLRVLFGVSVLFGLGLASWQLSTNSIYPLSRLIFAVACGCVLSGQVREKSIYGALKGPFWRPSVFLAVGAGMFLFCYYIGLYAAVRSQRSDSPQDQLAWSETSLRFAPYSFEALFQASVLAGRSHQVATRAQTALFRKYVYVPVVLFERAVQFANQGDLNGARRLLEETLQYDPGYRSARDLLDEINENTRLNP